MFAARKSRVPTNANQKLNVWWAAPVKTLEIAWATTSVVRCQRSPVQAAFVRLNASEMAGLRPLVQRIQTAATD
jgi:hypothetical protein